MEQQHRANGAVSRAAQLLGLLLLASLGVFVALGPVRAQETPEPTNTPEPDTNTVVRLAAEAPVEPLPSGREVAVDVLVDNVEHVASYNFSIGFDPEKVSFVRLEDEGQFLETGQRPNVQCQQIGPDEGSVGVDCITLGPPVCLGGGVGASGSGLLGTVIFASKGKGDATLELATSTLTFDDVEPCPDGPVVAIPYRRGEALTIPIEGGGSGSSTGLLIGVIAGVAVAVVVVAGGGLLWYRRRRAGS